MTAPERGWQMLDGQPANQQQFADYLPSRSSRAAFQSDVLTSLLNNIGGSRGPCVGISMAATCTVTGVRLTRTRRNFAQVECSREPRGESNVF